MSRYGEARVGVDVYGVPVQQLVAGGRYTTEVAYYRADADNVRREEVTGLLDDGEVRVDTTQAVPGSLKARCDEVRALAPYRDWIAPVLTVTTPAPDGRDDLIVSRQMGLFCVMPPGRSWLPSHGTEAVAGVDAVWLLATSKVTRPYSLAAGRNVGEAMGDLCRAAGARHAVQATSRTLAKRKTWPIGTTRLTIFNDLAHRIGFVPAWADRAGRIRSRRSRRLGVVEPARTISSAAGMVFDSVAEEPDLARLCNEVTVTGNTPKGGTVRAYRINDDPGSPTSTVRLGTRSNPRVLPVVVELADEVDQEAVDALADRLMDRGSSVLVRSTVTTVPILDWEVEDLSRLDVETDWGVEVARGDHRWDQLTQPLGVDAATTWRFGKVMPWARVAA